MLYLGLLLFIFGFIVLHAPFTVVISTLAPAASDIAKSWKEILMAIAGLCAVGLIVKHRAWKPLVQDKLLWVIAGYVVLHIVTVALMPRGITSTLAGLAIDLRYIAFFTLVYIALVLYPVVRSLFVRIGAIGAALVAGFGTLQLFLPKDILSHIGYGKDTIAPYMTVDRNHDFIRINSTLRGPNPLGAYVATVVSIVTSFVLLQYKRLSSRSSRWLVGVLIFCLLVTLWISYSRSALLAAIFGIAVVALYVWGGKLKAVKPMWWLLSGCVVVALAFGSYMVGKDSSFVSNVILHEDPAEGNDSGSNDGHVESLQHGIRAMIAQPFGAGVGSTGTASYHGDSPLIIENQYLFIAHEVGWLGILLFLIIFIEVMRRLWLRRKDWLALGVFASGVGLGLIGILQPVWVDDTVSLIWWGLAAVAIASKEVYVRFKAK
ncbi:O-Antigen ligase [compost metagenome]